MKHYFVRHYDFANEYNLRYAETPTDSIKLITSGYEQITRRRAIELAAQERHARKYDSSFSGYADDYIYPAIFDDIVEEWNYHNGVWDYDGYYARLNPYWGKKLGWIK